MPPDPDNSRLHPVWAILIRSAAILAIGAALGLLSNALHPMGLPLSLGDVEGPGLPRWVWEKVEQLDPEQAYALWEDESIIFLDVRDRSDYDESHIPRSISLPYYDFTATYPKVRDLLPEDGPIVVYCYDENCPLGMRVAKRLLQMGYTQIIVLRGGIIAWRNQGYDLALPGYGGDASGEAGP